ncbi:MAG: TPR end-of-group domain-containing protein [Xanthobacteraceae bacterium]
MATTYAYRREKDKAFEWLERAYVARDSGLVTFVFRDPLLTNLRDDPRYKAILKKMNLPGDGGDAQP